MGDKSGFTCRLECAWGLSARSVFDSYFILRLSMRKSREAYLIKRGITLEPLGILIPTFHHHSLFLPFVFIYTIFTFQISFISQLQRFLFPYTFKVHFLLTFTCHYSIIYKISLASFHLYPFLLMEDHVFRRNNLEILGGSQYKEKGFSEGDYYPKCNFLKGVSPGKMLWRGRSGQKHLINGSRGWY